MQMSIKKDLAPIAVFALFAAVIMAGFIDLPFKASDHDEAGGCFWGTAARNYVRYGFIGTKFGLVENGGIVKPEEFLYNTHHPVLTPAIISFFIRIFGLHEWAIRLPFVISSIGSLFLCFFLAKRLWGRRTAILSSLAIISMPAYLHYSSVSDMGPIALFFSLGCIYFYLIWLESNSIFSIVCMAVTFVIAALASWDSYYIIPAIAAYNLVKEDNRKALFTAISLGVFLILAYFIHVIILTGPGMVVSNMRWALFYRSGFEMIRGNPLFVFEYSRQIWVWAWYLFTPPAVILTLFLLFISATRRKNFIGRTDYGFLSVFFIFGATKYLFFLNHSYNHPQRLYYLIPAAAFSVSLAIGFFLERPSRYVRRGLLWIFISVLFFTNFAVVTIPVFLSLKEDDSRRSFDISVDRIRPIERSGAGRHVSFKRFMDKATGPDDKIFTNKWCPWLQFYLDKNIDYKLASSEDLKKHILEKDGKNRKEFYIFESSKEPDINDMEIFSLLNRVARRIDSFSGGHFTVFSID